MMLIGLTHCQSFFNRVGNHMVLVVNMVTTEHIYEAIVDALSTSHTLSVSLRTPKTRFKMILKPLAAATTKVRLLHNVFGYILPQWG